MLDDTKHLEPFTRYLENLISEVIVGADYGPCDFHSWPLETVKTSLTPVASHEF